MYFSPGVLNTLDLKAAGNASNETDRREKNKMTDLKVLNMKQ